MIPVCIFTFELDGPAALMAAQSAKRAGLGPVFISVDAARPLAPALRLAMMAEGFRVREATFPRVLNLRGIDCYRGLIETYQWVLKESGATHLFRLDSDSLVNRAGRIKQAVADDVAAAALRTGEYPFYGYAMVLSKRVVDGIAGVIAKFGAIPGHRGNSMAEDHATGDMAGVLDLGEVRHWDYDPAGGYGAGWHFKAGAERMYYDRFDVVTFGNRTLLTGKDCARRDQVTAAMSQYLKILREAGLPV